MVILVLENLVSEGKTFWRLNIFLPFQERKGSFKESHLKKKKSHLQGPFTVSYPQIPQPISSYKNGKGNTIGQERGSQVPDCGVGDEFSMGFIKKSPRYTEYGR